MAREKNRPEAVVAHGTSGKLNYSKALGLRSLEEGNEQPMQLDTVMQLASSSKLITTIAVLQAVERGYIGLDDDISDLVPVLAAQPILTGFSWYGRPNTKPRENVMTLRYLLTQTAGTGYDFLEIHPLWRYRSWNQEPIAEGEYLEERMGYPLLHEPGEGWTYGSGISWAGKVLEEVTGLTLEEWVKRYMSEPLGLTSVTFFPDLDPEVTSRMATVSQRDESSGKLAYSLEKNKAMDLKDCLGGERAHANLEDFMAILYSLLLDDGKLLKKKTTAMMFQPQLSGIQRDDLRKCLDLPVWICNSILKKDEYDWGLGGVLIDGNGHEYLQKGTLMWSGLYHILWVSYRCRHNSEMQHPNTTNLVDRPQGRRLWCFRDPGCP